MYKGVLFFGILFYLPLICVRKSQSTLHHVLKQFPLFKADKTYSIWVGMLFNNSMVYTEQNSVR
jgi:hypothetical protein